METKVNPDKKTVGEWLLDLIFPRFCIGCHKEGSFLCWNCQSKIIKIKYPTCIKCQKLAEEGICPRCKSALPLTKTIIVGYHRDPILKELIHNLKYEGLKEIAGILGDLLIERLKQTDFPKNCTIVPVPLHKSRLSTRGFNQSTLIAKQIADQFSLNYCENLLERIKNTKPQISLTYQDRKSNLTSAFRIRPKTKIPNGTIILVDDVVTTGATIGECAKVLRQGGVRRIWLLALAHG
ncbi:MAG: ComF family protein [bacterium]|nr:ComF family protein [bacterium]